MSDKVLHVPELTGDDATVFAARGFNVLATANLRDRGVHEMSSALKRRFNFETVRPIRDRALETRLIQEQTAGLLGRRRGRDPTRRRRRRPPRDGVLTTCATGVTADGIVVEKPTAVMSCRRGGRGGLRRRASTPTTSATATSAGDHVARQLIGTVLKDNPEDGTKLRHYFDVVVKPRARNSRQWKGMLAARAELER